MRSFKITGIIALDAKLLKNAKLLKTRNATSFLALELFGG
jgi:hypothetical protein